MTLTPFEVWLREHHACGEARRFVRDRDRNGDFDRSLRDYIAEAHKGEFADDDSNKPCLSWVAWLAEKLSEYPDTHDCLCRMSSQQLRNIGRAIRRAARARGWV